MQLLRNSGLLAASLLAISLAMGCAATSHPPAASPGTPAATAPDRPIPSRRAAAPSRRAVASGPTLDRQGCDPTGKATVVVQKDADGQITRWLYFSNVRRPSGTARVLRCEAADNNGDGYVDARYFYDAQGELILEQRDLDFDGHAEVVADYSHFSAGHLTQAREVD